MYDDLKQRLRDAGRVLVHEGLGDYVAGHISMRLPDRPDQFLMKPAGMGLDEMTIENIITVNLDGMKTDGPSPRHNEVWIHSEILRTRPEINSVLHAHPEAAVAFSSLDKPLLPVSNDGSIFYAGVPVFSETTDLITTRERGEAVARTLGPEKRALILRNHGIVTCSPSIEETVWIGLKLERACRIQLAAEAAGGPKLLVREEEVAAKAQKANRSDLHTNVFNYLVRRSACPYCDTKGRGIRID
jgi:ribulose-5-phosphate 4-epimerase/fuculose-1-phosphate aldolase